MSQAHWACSKAGTSVIVSDCNPGFLTNTNTNENTNKSGEWACSKATTSVIVSVCNPISQELYETHNQESVNLCMFVCMCVCCFDNMLQTNPCIKSPFTKDLNHLLDSGIEISGGKPESGKSSEVVKPLSASSICSTRALSYLQTR